MKLFLLFSFLLCVSCQSINNTNKLSINNTNKLSINNTNKPSINLLDIELKNISAIKEIFGEEKFTGPAGTDNKKYYYGNFEVTARNETGELNTIIIFDPKFEDVNGIRVFDSYSKVIMAVGEENLSYQEKSKFRYVFDKVNGIAYWFKNNAVSKIVLSTQKES